MSKRRRRRWLLALVPLVASGLVVGMGILDRKADTMPASIGGVPRLDTDQTRAAIEQARKMTEATGGSGEIAYYGRGETASFVVFLYEEPVPVSFDQEFRAFSYGFMGTSGANLSPDSMVDELVGGIRYRCESDPRRSMSVCVMGEDRRFTSLAVLDSGDLHSAYELALKVQAATADMVL